MRRVRVHAPARLHLGMLDVAGGGPRRFGGIGVAVDGPVFVVEAERAAAFGAEGPDAERALAFARRSAEGLGLAGAVHVCVQEAIPAHHGLGSGTKLGLAVAAAVAALAGREVAPEQLAAASGRGARSAVGLWTFALGGLVVEGGVRAGSQAPSPLLVRRAMPAAWRCVLVVPDADPGISGHAEQAAFRRLEPRREEAARVSQLVLTSLLPALVDGDLEEFGATLTSVQQLVGDAFSEVQGGRFHPLAAPLVAALLDAGAAGAGQTSWGPAVYGLCGHAEAAATLAERMRALVGDAGDVRVAGFPDHGACVEVEP